MKAVIVRNVSIGCLLTWSGLAAADSTTCSCDNGPESCSESVSVGGTGNIRMCGMEIRQNISDILDSGMVGNKYIIRTNSRYLGSDLIIWKTSLRLDEEADLLWTLNEGTLSGVNSAGALVRQWTLAPNGSCELGLWRGIPTLTSLPPTKRVAPCAVESVTGRIFYVM